MGNFHSVSAAADDGDDGVNVGNGRRRDGSSKRSKKDKSGSKKKGRDAQQQGNSAPVAIPKIRLWDEPHPRDTDAVASGTGDTKHDTSRSDSGRNSRRFSSLPSGSLLLSPISSRPILTSGQALIRLCGPLPEAPKEGPFDSARRPPPQILDRPAAPLIFSFFHAAPPQDSIKGGKPLCEKFCLARGYITLPSTPL